MVIDQKSRGGLADITAQTDILGARKQTYGGY